MKWISIFAILIIFSIGLITSESDERGVDVEEEARWCMAQIRNQAYLEDLCMTKAFNETEFLIELNTNIVNYSGDDTEFYTFANKYCPQIHETLRCTNVGGEIDPKCQYPPYPERTKIRNDVAYEFINFVCENNASVVLQVLANNGVETVYNNREFKNCMKLIDSNNDSDEETYDYKAEICNGIDRFIDCYNGYVRDHNNKNLVQIANDLRGRMREAIKCTSGANE